MSADLPSVYLHEVVCPHCRITSNGNAGGDPDAPPVPGECLSICAYCHGWAALEVSFFGLHLRPATRAEIDEALSDPENRRIYEAILAGGSPVDIVRRMQGLPPADGGT